MRPTSNRPGAVKTRALVYIAAGGTAVGLIAGGVVAASGAGSSGGPPPRIAAAPNAYVAQTANGPGLNVANAVSSVLSGLGSAKVVSDISTVADTEWGSKLPWVKVTLSANPDVSAGDGDIRATWLGGLAQGAVADQMRTTEPSILNVLGGGEVVEPSPDGTGTVTIPLGIGNVAGGQILVAPPDATLQSRASAVAEQFGLTVQNVQFLHPLGTAMDVTFTVPDSLTPTWTIDQLRSALVGSPMQLDGVMITFESPAGSPLLASGVAYRAGQGGLWFAKGQDRRFGALHGGVAQPQQVKP